MHGDVAENYLACGQAFRRLNLSMLQDGGTR